MIKLAFYKGPEDIFGKAIRLWTWGKYSHVEVMIGGEMFSSRAGIGTRCLMYPRIIDGQWDYVDVPVDAGQEAHISKWCVSEMNCRYDWRGIFLSQILFLNREDPDKWFCSEFCAAALKVGGLLPGVVPHKMSPNGLYRKLTR